MRKKFLIGLAVAGSLMSAAFAQTSKQQDLALTQSLQALASQGNAEAEYHLGMHYNNGIGVAKSPAQAYQRFEKAAAMGDPLAAYKLGCYAAGQFPEVMPVPNKARALEQKLIAAEAGYVLAQLDVSSMYLQGANYAEGLPWLQRAADQGEAKALYNLSVGHLKGWWPSADKSLAYAYFKLAKLVADGSINPRAQTSLAEMEKQLTADDLARANDFVAAWKPKPSALTLKARSGAAAAKALVKVAAATQQ
jgi:TPR repeat protein